MIFTIKCVFNVFQVTLNNEDNSNYLLAYGDGELVDTVLRVFMTCGSQILLYPVTSVKDKLSVGAVLRDCLVATLKILINITHDFNNKCKKHLFKSFILFIFFFYYIDLYCIKVL